MKQLTEKEIIEHNTPILIDRLETWIPSIIKKGKKSEIEIVEVYLITLKERNILKKITTLKAL